MIQAIARAGLAVGALFLALGVAANSAAAKQCVWNKGGYVMRVDWFNPGTADIRIGDDGNTELRFSAQPVQTDVFPTASGRCINRENVVYTAVISICGGTFNNRVMIYPDEWPVSRRIDCSIWGAGQTSTTRYWDFWGTTWNVQYGEGGPI